MVSSVAVLSDIHGVLPALDAVLAEPDVESADAVVLCGDLAAGPLPRQTLDRLVALGERAVWVRGNADRELVDLAGGGTTAIPDPIAPWAAGQLRPDQVALLAGLPLSVTLDVDGLGEVLFCHATPRDDEEVVLVDSPLPRWAEVLDVVTVETVVCGHTHMPFTRLADRTRIVNPGSVGMPYGTTGAHWALLGPGIQLRRTPYDAGKACEVLAAESGYADITEWADYFVRNPVSDAEALRVFSPRARGTSAT
ncbi:metallophosphoesterase [Amycolatopsis sp. FDAARGOS 1241]|uniref:metallophosphoesterase family protein n=1 Tax=Amycolatopsis sp. FDAARGOS 1241 TaxID=2778070 RepID=UPI00194E293C|nr:metallophosphoesterase family protein [Amycolatopsis sp. FDAARGOS 1241]QRP43851.1 metallophosphoesterase family protein [Amycolatopsis sp. FDAARGOS 1241]